MPWPVEATAQRALSQTQKYPLAGTSRPRPPTPTGGCPRPPPRLPRAPGHRSQRPPRQPAPRHSGRSGTPPHPPPGPGSPRRRQPARPGQPTPCPRAASAPERADRPGAGSRGRRANSGRGRRRPPDPTPTPTTTGAPRATRTLRRSTRNRPWTGTRRPRPWRVPPGRPPQPAPSRQRKAAAGPCKHGVQESPADCPGPPGAGHRQRPVGPCRRSRLPESGRSAPSSNVGSYPPEESVAPEPDAGAGTAALRTRGGPGPALRRSSVGVRRV